MGNQTDFARIERSARIRSTVSKAVIYTLLTFWAVMVLFPFYWMLLSSVKSYGAYNAEYIPQFITTSPTLENYFTAFTAVPLGDYFLNTLVGYIYDMLYDNSGGYPSYASAAAIILFAIVLTITCINLLVSRKHVHYA